MTQSDALANLGRELNRVLRIEDPLRRAALIQTGVLPKLGQLTEVIYLIRAQAVLELWDDGRGPTYRDIARQLGVSKPLVQQMIAFARAEAEGDLL